jgi:hypothetical protein
MQEPRSQRTLFLATYASSEYSRSNKLRSDAELISVNTPVLLAWIEFNNIEQLIPLYRYIILPLKAITAEEILTQGKYVANLTLHSKSLPAKLPSTVTNGAVVTDWQYCYDCITTQALNKLNPAVISYIGKETKKLMLDKPIDNLYFINNPKEAPYLKSRSSVTVYSGDEAQKQQSILITYVQGLSEDIAQANQYDEEYRYFTETKHKPLTFSYWANQAGCPAEIANRREIHGDRRSQANAIIELNKRYIECNSKVLENYDVSAYIAEYENIYAREEALWERSNKSKRHRVIHPEAAINGIIQSIEQAGEGIESAYKQLELADKLDARNRQLDAYSRQNWADTFNRIQARNNLIKTQHQQTQKILQKAANTQTSNSRSPRNPNPQPERKAATANTTISSAGDHSSKETTATAEPETKQTSRTQVSTNGINTSSQPTGQVNKQNKASNKYLGSGRDYPFTGASQAYHRRELAEDLARTNLMNQASQFCGSGLKTEILWSDQAYCKPSASEQGNFKCSIDALVNCYDDFCEEEFCGTAM